MPTNQPHDHHHVAPATDPLEFWENHYGAREQIWSGRVNPILAEVAGILTPGRALDIGAGEGGDAVWLAQQGWQVRAVDISATALDRTRKAAADAGVSDQVTTQQLDLTRELPQGEFDLISAQFFQSPIEFPRDRVLRDLAGQLATGGQLLLVDHQTTPTWGGHHEELPTPDQTVASLALPEIDFEVERTESRSREVTGPEGQTAQILDAVILVHRR